MPVEQNNTLQGNLNDSESFEGKNEMKLRTVDGWPLERFNGTSLRIRFINVLRIFVLTSLRQTWRLRHHHECKWTGTIDKYGNRYCGICLSTNVQQPGERSEGGLR